MAVRHLLLKGVAALATLGFILWEIPSARRIAGIAVTAITGFDFVYERYRDPSWLGGLFRTIANPPPGLTLTVIAIAMTLIYWSTKSKDRRMTASALGMVICA